MGTKSRSRGGVPGHDLLVEHYGLLRTKTPSEPRRGGRAGDQRKAASYAASAMQIRGTAV